MNIAQVLRGHGIGVGKRSTGTAVAGDVLVGKTFTNSTGDVTGTMAEYAGIATPVIGTNLMTGITRYTDNVHGTITVTPSAAGHYDLSTSMDIRVFNLLVENIKSGVQVGGVTPKITGTFTNDATIVAGDVLSGKTGYKSGALVTGTMANRTTDYGAPSSGQTGRIYITPSAGYHNGTARVYSDDGNFDPANWRADKNIYGVQGTMPIKTSTNGDGPAANHHIATDAAAWDGRLFMRPTNTVDTRAYTGDVWLTVANSNFTPTNIRNGVNILGLTGSLVPGTAYASGVTTRIATGSGNAKISVRGLSFTPAYVLIDCDPISSSTNGVAGYIVSYGIPRNYYSNDSQFMYNNTDVGTGDNQFQIVAGGFDLICYAGSVNPDVFWRAWQGA